MLQYVQYLLLLVGLLGLLSAGTIVIANHVSESTKQQAIRKLDQILKQSRERAQGMNSLKLDFAVMFLCMFVKRHLQ